MVNKAQQPAKPTSQQDAHDKNIDQQEKRGAKQQGAKPSNSEEDERGTYYGQREGSTVSEDNDVE